MLTSEYFGSGDHKDRTARIYEDDEGYFVEFWQDDTAVKQVDVRDHSLYYAEDTAENWISGLIKA